MASNEIKPGDLPVFDTATSLAFDAIITAVMTNIVAAVPLFGVSGLNYITKQIVTWVLKFAWMPLQNLAAFFIIDRQQEIKAEAYKEAVKELDQAIKNNPDLNSEEVKRAHEEFKKKLGELIKIKHSPSDSIRML